MKVALIYPPYKPHTVFSENLRAVDDEFLLGPPIILAYVAAILEKAGHKVMLLDANVLGLSKEQVLKAIRKFDPDVMGFRLETYHFHETLDWIRYLKKNIPVPVIGGGINVTFYPEESLFHREIDYGIVGEATPTLPRLLHTLENKSDTASLAGIVYRENNKIIVNQPSDSRIDFNDYPFPARHHLPNNRYHSFVSQRRNFTIMLTSIGCPFKCTFCVISKIPYKNRKPMNVVDEIEECYRKHGVREIDFFDGALFVYRDRIIDMCREMRNREIDVEWSCRSRVDLVNEELLKEAYHAGCRRIFYGIESSNQNILRAIRKDVNLAQIKKAIQLTRKNHIQPLGFFMVGIPGDTAETVMDTIRFSKKLKFSYIHVCRTIAKPGTDLDKMLIKESGTDYWKEYILGNVEAKRLPNPWTELTEKEIENLVKKFYVSFYFRPVIILERLLRLKSFDELCRYVRVAFRMLFHRKEIL